MVLGVFRKGVGILPRFFPAGGSSTSASPTALVHFRNIFFIGNSKGAIVDQGANIRILTCLKKEGKPVKDILKDFLYGGQQLMFGSINPDNSACIYAFTRGKKVGDGKVVSAPSKTVESLISLVAFGVEDIRKGKDLSKILVGFAICGAFSGIYIGYTRLEKQIEVVTRYDTLLEQQTETVGKIEGFQVNVKTLRGKVDNLSSNTDATYKEAIATREEATATRDEVREIRKRQVAEDTKKKTIFSRLRERFWGRSDPPNRQL